MALSESLRSKVGISSRRASGRELALQACVGGLYFVAGKLGLTLAFTHSFITPIWPAAGVALAVLLLLGYGLWPGVLLGSFLLNLTIYSAAGANFLGIVASSLSVAAGNVLAAVAGAWLVESYAKGRDALLQPHTILLFVVLGAVASTVLSATSGVLVCWLVRLTDLRHAGDLWSSWWLADMVGVVLFTPLILAWATVNRPSITAPRMFETVCLGGLLLLSCWITFGGWSAAQPRMAASSFLVIPILLWTAFRFGQRGTTFVIFMVGCLATVGTLQGHGPFAAASRDASLFLLQDFLGGLALILLLLAADVEQRRRGDAELRTSEHRYRQLFENNPQPSWVFDRETLRILDVNPAAVEYYGYSREQFLDMRFRDLWAKEDEPPLSNRFTEALGSPTAQVHCRHRKKDGSIIDVEVARNDVAYDGRPAGLVLIQDVTGRMQTEVALRESNERLKLALAASQMGIWTMELNNPVRFVSDSQLDTIFGLNPGEFDGSEKALFDLIHREDHQLVREAIARATKIEGDCEVEFRILPRNRTLGWVLARGRAYFDSLRKPIRLIGVILDITAQKQAQQEVLRLNSELEHRVHERTDQLAAINRELEAFSYSVSHDLRAPLRSVRGFCQVLLDRYETKLDARGREFLRRAAESSQHMDRLIDDVLQFSRISRTELRPRSINLSSLAETIAGQLLQSEPQRHVKFAITPGLVASGEERLLRVVLDNLLRNAWKFTAKKLNARIEFGHAAGPPSAFFVRDNGAGFDMRYADRLFGVFQRLHTATEFPGTGIGLATVQRILNRHGGRAWAEGVPQRGATFYFTLPPHQGS